MNDFFYVGPAAAPIGIVGVQFYGDNALLRSLVVITERRTQGLGQRLVEHAERHARKRGAAAVYLLTTTAESFFQSRGYTVTPCDSAPRAIRSTPEFAGEFGIPVKTSLSRGIRHETPARTRERR
jgi:amino-acid N-acetyltransferase